MRGSRTEISPGVWRLRVYVGRRPNGTPIQVSKTFKGGARDADTELASLVAKAGQGQLNASAATVGDLLDRWLAHCESLGRSATTMQEYRRLVDKVVEPELGKVRLSKLTAANLDRLYAKLTAKGLKPTSVRRVHALIAAALHQAERWDLVDRNVARRASPPPVRPARITAPSPKEVQAVVTAAEAIEPGLAALLMLAALTGCRRGELCALRWSDLDWKAGTLTVARSVYDTEDGGWAEKSTKTHQERRIGLDELAMAGLRRHREQVDKLAAELQLDVLPDGFMFSRSPVGAEPVRPNIVTKFAVRAAKDAGLAHLHMHQLRHFSATQAIGAGFDPVTVAARLGHADPSITLQVYAHAIEQRDRDLAAALGRALAPADAETADAAPALEP